MCVCYCLCYSFHLLGSLSLIPVHNNTASSVDYEPHTHKHIKTNTRIYIHGNTQTCRRADRPSDRHILLVCVLTLQYAVNIFKQSSMAFLQTTALHMGHTTTAPMAAQF